jgi:hypothetical protein
MADIKIIVINESTVLKDDQVKSTVPALQTQVQRDFAPVWGIDANITFLPSGSQPPLGSWWLGVFDDSDQAGALGYHDVTNEGLPLGKVFAGTDMKFGANWTVTLSHELLEMLADPEINLTVFDQSNNTTGILYAYEVCDACEADQFGYQIDGITVSDFVYPTWFEVFQAGRNVQFDYSKQIRNPFDLLPGGYTNLFDVMKGGGWIQKTAEDISSRYPLQARIHPRVGSRRERRKVPRDMRLKSQVRFGSERSQAQEELRSRMGITAQVCP